jgi:hypothetical protein
MPCFHGQTPSSDLLQLCYMEGLCRGQVQPQYVLQHHSPPKENTQEKINQSSNQHHAATNGNITNKIWHYLVQTSYPSLLIQLL